MDYENKFGKIDSRKGLGARLKATRDLNIG